MKNNTDKNYFVVNRSLLYSDRWLSEPFTRGQAWIDLFGLANHTEGFIRVRGLQIPLERGQLGWSQIKLSRRWKWSRNKVRRYLKELEKNNDIVLKTIQQNSKATSIITVVKYNSWQLSGTSNDTTEGQQKDNRRGSNKKKKKKKKLLLKDKSFKTPALLVKDKQRHVRIVGIYWLKKKFTHPNKLAADKAFGRDIVGASNLAGYENKDILSVMDWLEEDSKRGGYKWTLGTVHKEIDEYLTAKNNK